MSDVVTLKIDDRDVGGRDDQTILEVARENGVAIPTLCHLEGLSSVGACRVCLVEVKGSRKLLPACMTPVTEGMEVITNSELIQAQRRVLVELIFSEGNHICAVCVSNGHCELQSLAQYLGVDHIRLPYLDPRREVDASHKRYMLDHNRCILCSRCVRVCDEVEGAHTWDIRNRGIRSMIVSDMFTPWGESPSCTSCGKCVHVCPTGALFEKEASVAEMAKHREFLAYLKEVRHDN